MSPPLRSVVVALTLGLALSGSPAAQIRLADESDRAAFRLWFVLLADAQFYRPSGDVIDCAALIRHALREALRAHTPEWVRRYGSPLAPPYPDVRRPPLAGSSSWPLFRVSATPSAAYAEFADAHTIVTLNTRPIGRDVAAIRPGDLLYFHQPEQKQPHHLMVFVGDSRFEPDARDWVVYHTGPSSGARASDPPDDLGEIRKVRLADLRRHPAPRWRPERGNPRFVGIFRLLLL